MYSCSHEKSSLARAVLPALLVATALGFRLAGLGFGLPLWSNFYIRPDETLLVVPAAELFIRHGNPGHVNYPALMIEVLAVIFRLVHGIASFAGGAAGAFIDDFAANPSRYFYVGRLLSALCGAGLTLVVYLLAVRWTSALPAALAAMWYAISPLAVREAHFAVTDTPMSLLVGCSFLVVARFFEDGAARGTGAVAWCGCVAGMALATKYTAGIILPAIAIALLCTPGESGPTARLRRAMVFLAVAAGVFMLLNPWILLHPGQLLEWLRTLFRAIYGERPGIAAGAGVFPLLARATNVFVLLPGGWIGLAFGTAGLVAGLLRWRRTGDGRLIALLAGTLGFTALLAPARTLPFRYLSPLLPLAAVCAGIGLEAFAGCVTPRLRTAILVVAGVAGIAMTCPDTFRLVGSLELEDTRSEAGRWIRANVPRAVPIVWLGEPESEPQVQESAASLQRRVAYAERRYGPVAARVIDRLYLLLMRAPAAIAPGASEVYRDPSPSEVTERTVCVVQAAYPLPMVRTDERALAAWTRGRIVRQIDIGPTAGSSGTLLERSDAFFLPLDPDRVLQPGPRLSLYLVELDPALESWD